jgi:phosphohistidine phosphatase
MKKLIFVRHGKAEDPVQEISDFERSLTLKGKTISKLMAVRLREREETAGTILTSPAFRALETAIIFANEFHIKPDEIIISSSLYYNMRLQYLPDILSLINDNSDTVTLFGHNPSFTEIAGSLSKEGCDFMPKSGIICISFNVKKWSEIKSNNGKTEYFLKPAKTL